MKFSKKDFTLVPSRQARIGMPANQQVVYMWLCEHSDDDGKSFPSRKVLAYECGMSIDTLDRSLKELIKNGLVAKSGRYNDNKQMSNLYEVLLCTVGAAENGRGRRIGTGGAANLGRGGPQISHTELYPINQTHLKDSTNVESATAYGKPELNELFVYWEQRTGIGIASKRQLNRNACSNLFKRYGAERMRQLIDGVALSQADKYAPRIADFCDLQAKLTQLLAWGKQHTAHKKGVKIT